MLLLLPIAIFWRNGVARNLSTSRLQNHVIFDELIKA
jgi:hypothetical protein